MRPTLQLLTRIRVIPASAIQPGELRLPPKGYKMARPTNKGTPTIEKAAETAQLKLGDVPANLRLEEFIPPRQLYAGISEGDRDILKSLARE